MVLQIRSLHVCYFDNNKEISIIKDLNLNLEQGHVCTLLGESGSGKTTLLKAIAGLTPIKSGKIYLKNINITDLPPNKRKVGYIPQEPTLFQHLNVFENIAFGLRIANLKNREIKEKVEQYASLVGISNLLGRSVEKISGGQAQRVSLCRALVPEPSLMLFDEPFSSLDSNLKYKLVLEFKMIQKELNITTLHVTHDQYEGRLIGDQIGIISDCKLQQVSKKDSFFPKNWRIAKILGFTNVISPKNYSLLNLDKEFSTKYPNGGYLDPNRVIFERKPSSELKGKLIGNDPIVRQNFSVETIKPQKIWIRISNNHNKEQLYFLGTITDPIISNDCIIIANLLESFIPFR